MRGERRRYGGVLGSWNFGGVFVLVVAGKHRAGLSVQMSEGRGVSRYGHSDYRDPDTIALARGAVGTGVLCPLIDAVLEKGWTERSPARRQLVETLEHWIKGRGPAASVSGNPKEGVRTWAGTTRGGVNRGGTGAGRWRRTRAGGGCVSNCWRARPPP